MNSKFRLYAFSVPWNIFLLTVGSFFVAMAIKSVAVPHGLVSGGVSGIALLIYYFTSALTPGLWLFLLNIPIAVLGWVMVSRRFVLYTAYGMASITLWMELIAFTLPIDDILLASIFGGALLGAGAGISMRSLGSSGGLDIIGIILHQRFGFRIGQISFLFNAALFAVSFALLETDLVLYSLIMVFVTAQIMDYVLSMFNQRKLVFVISDHAQTIADAIMKEANRGVTLLEGRGGYTGQPKQVVMTVVNNVQQKKLEEMIFTLDPEAFVIFENTFNVIGKGFSRRKVY
ncbi:MAG: YitT family protein [Desulfomicrobium sp.]|nr:YitT family protein [Pseudomonadota bacterium]MBV1712183.1 YitT family protein [Desulfomicrobium sp.]MBU4572821.1 YitT family protein [Pseudomonadota bacterium]MBU4594816.1 YitT family protein [Pseudomonadota bacterium]MBV1718545.1 YitT family protein [Desulfomicrobium sp.]